MKVLRPLLLIGALLCPSLATAQGPPRLKLAIDVKRPVIEQGHAKHLLLDISMTNLSSAAIDCSSSLSNGIDPNDEIVLKDEHGLEVHKKVDLADLDASPMLCLIQPGATREMPPVPLSVLYNFEKPGNYTVTVSRLTVRGDVTTRVTSNSIMITVVPEGALLGERTDAP